MERLVSIVTDAPKDGDRLMALERIKELILLGAVQEAEFSDEMRRRVASGSLPVERAIDDPFVNNLKVS